jgi:hypothetical protein
MFWSWNSKSDKAIKMIRNNDYHGILKLLKEGWIYSLNDKLVVREIKKNP